MPRVDPIYMDWLTHQTRSWQVHWADDGDAVRHWLEPAVEHPLNTRYWRNAATWDLVRVAVNHHETLSHVLDAWQWPNCQAWWYEHTGLTWDPYALAFAVGHRHPAQWQRSFIDLLHHPIQPGLALWAYGVWRSHPSVDLPDLSGCSPMTVIDTILRAGVVADDLSETAWAMARQDWVETTPPGPDDPEPVGRYPTTLVMDWEQALAPSEPEPVAPPLKASQLQWF